MGPLSAVAPDGQRRTLANKPVDVALNEIVTRARVFTDAGGAAIALREGSEIVTRASSGGIAPDVGTRMAIDSSLTGQAVLKGTAVHVQDSDRDPRVDAETCRILNTRAFIITPISGSTTILGVLAVFASTPNAFTRTDLAVLRTMADQISAAVGGGAFLPQSWPAAKEDGAQIENELQQEAPAIQEIGPVAASQPAEPHAPKNPQVADIEFSSLAHSAPISKEVTETPVTQAPRRTGEVEVELDLETIPGLGREKPPVASTDKIQKKALAPEAVTPARAKPIPARPGRQSNAPAPLPRAKAAEPAVLSLADIIDARAKTPESDTIRPIRAPRPAPRAEMPEWSGLSIETQRQPAGRIVAGVVAMTLIVAAIVGGMVLRKAHTKTAATAPITAPSPASSGPSSASNAATTASTPSNAPSETVNSKQPLAKAAQQQDTRSAKPAPAIVLAPSTGPARPAVNEDQAPPQLAFSGERPRLVDRAPTVPSVAAPARPVTSPVPPQLIRRVDPIYPEMAQRLHQKGFVELQAQILKDGSVGRVEVISGAALLRQAATDAVKRWRYKPAELGGTPVESTVNIVVRFDSNR